MENVNGAVDVDTEILQSPIKPRYADRFIPTRYGKSWDVTFAEAATTENGARGQDSKDISRDLQKTPVDRKPRTHHRSQLYRRVLKNEVLGYDIDSPNSNKSFTCCRKLFHYDSSEQPFKNISCDDFSPYSTSPVSRDSEKVLTTPSRPRQRRISKAPFKVLDAPDLVDDFYLNLLDWSSYDIVAVALGTQLYAWSALTNEVSKITNLENVRIASVKWHEKGKLMAFGCHEGYLRVLDVESGKMVFCEKVHNSRVNTLEWNGDILFSGSKDRKIRLHDFRGKSLPTSNLLFEGHSQEVCGLKWSSFNTCLASGGNDNKVILWDVRSRNPLHVLSSHVAAVKGLSWSPHTKYILASGGGTQDRCIKFWNAYSGACTGSVDTGSQVCNIGWSPHSNEIVSTHGYAENSIILWKYPSMRSVVSLSGHQQRVLYMAMNPSGEAICTGAGDETLRFWNLFKKNSRRSKKSPLDLFKIIR